MGSRTFEHQVSYRQEEAKSYNILCKQHAENIDKNWATVFFRDERLMLLALTPDSMSDDI